MQIYLKKY